MMNKKTSLQFILAGIVMVSFAVTGCNNDSEKAAEPAKDTTAVAPMEATPATPAATDTTKRDTAKTRPVVPAN